LARFGQIWPDSARLARFRVQIGQIWPDSGPDWPDLARFRSRLARSGQIPGFRTILARGGPSSGILVLPGGVRIPGGAPNWHKSGGGGISCIRSSGTLSPGTYRSQILAETRTRALGTRILGTFREFSAEMDHFSGTPPGTRFWPPGTGFWTPPGQIRTPPGRPDWPDSARFGQFGHFWPDSGSRLARSGQIP